MSSKYSDLEAKGSSTGRSALAGVQVIFTDTSVNSRARRLYERHGYVEVRRSQLGRFELVHYEKEL